MANWTITINHDGIGKAKITIHRPEPRADWVATDDNYDGAPDGNNDMGRGATAWLAFLDLMEQTGGME